VADRTRYLLAYDIREDKRLRRVHEVAVGFGEPLQYSLFVCDLTRAELILLRSRLIDEMHLDVDSVAIFQLGEPTGRGVRCTEFLGKRRPLPNSGPTIW
jgi:CRISPR-associated protein Cas2